MSQEGRIGGPLLAQNLLRNGTDLAFETSLLYLNVGSQYIGINTQGPSSDLTIGTVKNNGDTTDSKIGTVNLRVDTTANIGNFTIGTNTIQHLTSSITVTPASTGNYVIDTANLSVCVIRAAVGNNSQNDVTLLTEAFNGRPLADVNNTGNVTASDALAVQKYIQGGYANTSPTDDVYIRTVFFPKLLSNIVKYSKYLILAPGPVITPGLSTANLYFSSNTLANTITNSSTNITAAGTGQVKLNSNVLVNAALHATGNITWDGNITLGNAVTDTITFAAEVASDIIPVATLNAGPSPAKQLIGQNSKLFIGIDDEALLFLNPSNLVTPLSVPYLTQDSQILLAEDGSTLFSNPVAPYQGSSYLYNLGSSSLTWATVYATTASLKNSVTATGVVTATKLNAGNIGITGTTIANNFLSDPVAFSTSGSGSVKFNGSSIFVANTINVPASSSLTISSTGTGYVKFADTNGIVTPVGTTLNRPASPVQGQTRYNTNFNYEEIYDAGAGGWIPIYGGVSALATIDNINNDSILYAIIFGR